VWKNAFIFNGPDSPYFKSARKLNDQTEKKLEELERECETVSPSTGNVMERCGYLLVDMTNNPLSEWFREPVDHVGLGLADYLTVVQTPMDLGTIQKKIERGQYMGPEDFAHDVRLVWDNAIRYNSAASMFGVVASILHGIFDRRFAMLTRSAMQDPGRPVPDKEGWPTFTQKKKFYDLCTKLSLADLNHMVQMVQKTCERAVTNIGDKEAEVDVDEIDMDTFNKALAWVTSRTKPVKEQA